MKVNEKKYIHKDSISLILCVSEVLISDVFSMES